MSFPRKGLLPNPRNDSVMLAKAGIQHKTVSAAGGFLLFSIPHSSSRHQSAFMVSMMASILSSNSIGQLEKGPRFSMW